MFQLKLIRPVTKDSQAGWRHSSRKHSHQDKMIANRRFRHRLKLVCKQFEFDSDLFWSEAFNMPQLTGWDID